MKYRIVRTAVADEQVRDIIFYILDDTCNPSLALRYLEKLEKVMVAVSENPYIGVKPRYAILRRQGFWVLQVDNHLIFYKVDEEKREVTIYSVVDGSAEHWKMV